MLNVLIVVVSAAVGYAFGAVSPAVLLARSRSVDLRELGSGNPGATNVGRLLGVRWGVTVGLLDVTKGLVPALVMGLLIDELAGLVAGAAAVVGHVFSPFLRGRGGKGVATAFGAVLGVDPVWALVLLAVFVVVFLIGRWVALASMASALALVPLALSTDVSTARRVWAVSLAVLILVRHRKNVVARWRARRVYG